MTDYEYDLLMQLGNPFDIFAAKREYRDAPIQKVEAELTTVPYLLHFYVAFRHHPGWPNEEAIVACVRVVMLAAGTYYAGAINYNNAVYHANEAVNAVLRARQEQLPDGARLALVQPTHDAFCKLIREILKPPTECSWPWSVSPAELKYALCAARVYKHTVRCVADRSNGGSNGIGPLSNWLYEHDRGEMSLAQRDRWKPDTERLFALGVFSWACCPVDEEHPRGNKLVINLDALDSLIAEIENAE